MSNAHFENPPNRSGQAKGARRLSPPERRAQVIMLLALGGAGELGQQSGGRLQPVGIGAQPSHQPTEVAGRSGQADGGLEDVGGAFVLAEVEEIVESQIVAISSVYPIYVIPIIQ